ncbi:MAG TPA: hypothetical protein PKW95_17030 [bacterium]|nr:hypothetical protein [bacterium]
MNKRRLLLAGLTICGALVLAAALGWIFAGEPVAWSAPGLPGSAQRIAAFPELVRLSQIDYRPAGQGLPALPFAVKRGANTVVAPDIEQQTLLNAPTFVPRPPADIVAAYGGKSTLSAPEREALVAAYLDLGRVDDAVAVRAAVVAAAGDDLDARDVLIALLDEQNRIDACLAAIDEAFTVLLAQGTRETDARRRDKLIERARALLLQRERVRQRGLRPEVAAETDLRLIDAFTQRPDLLLDYADRLLSAERYADVIAQVQPRIERYQVDRVRLWEKVEQAYDRLGRLGEAASAVAADSTFNDDSSLCEAYVRLLRQAKLFDARRAEAFDRLAAHPTAATLRDAVRLEIYRWRNDLARETLEKYLPRIGADADADTLIDLSKLADDAGLYSAAASLALNAALLRDDPATWLAAARRLDRAPTVVAWPLDPGAGSAFALHFVDRGPGVFGGLVSLGANRMGARGAMQAMNDTAARLENRRLALRLALSASEKSRDAHQAYLADDFAKGLLVRLARADRIDRLARAQLERFGADHPDACWILQWHADAAAVRKDDEARIAALQKALSEGHRLGQIAAADRAERNLEDLLMRKKRYADVLALKWQRVQARPDDEQAIEVLLSFAERYRLFADAERAYRLAIERFDRRAWSDKFARWLLRKKRRADFQTHVEETAKKLGPSELASFLTTHVHYSSSDSAANLFYEKVYLIALERFPTNRAFAGRLLDFYERIGFDTRHPNEEYQNKFLDLGLRFFALNASWPDRLLARLGQRGMLDGLAAKLEQSAPLDLAATYLWTRVQQYAARFEAALPGYAALDEYWPRSTQATATLATLARSLSDSFTVRDPALAAQAAQAQGRLAARAPLNTELPTVQGEIWLAAGQPREAARTWEGIVAAGPGESDRWLQLATLYWDYYLPEQAMGTLRQAREVLGKSDLHAKEMAYLLEDEGKIDAAVAELIKVVLGDEMNRWEATVRLRTLVRAKKTTQLKIDVAFEKRLRRPEARGADGATYLQWLRDQGRAAEARAIALRLLPVFADAVYAESAYDMYAQYGDDDGMKACLDRLLVVSNRDAAILWRLVAWHQNRKETAEADKLVEEIVARPDTPTGRRAAYNSAAYYYWNSKRTERALEYYRLLAENEQGETANLNAWIVYAQRCREAGQPRRALEALETLRRGKPLETSLIGAMAAAYAAVPDTEGLAALYRQALKDLREASLDGETRRETEVAFRRHLIEAETTLGRSRDAVEQHILIVNRLAPDREAVLAAHGYAVRHNQLPPLLSYYEREAQRAHKDFRWQQVLATLYEAEGRYAEAGAMLDRAAANAPQRNELLEQRALVLIKAGDFDGAVEVYRTLAARRLSATDYQLRIAEVLYQAGRSAEAEAWLAQIFAAEQIHHYRLIEAAKLAERFHRPATGRLYADRAIAMVAKDPVKHGLTDELLTLWLRAQLADHGVTAALNEMRTLRGRIWNVYTTAHPVSRYGLKNNLNQIDRLLQGWFSAWLADNATVAQRDEALGPLSEMYAAAFDDATDNFKNVYQKVRAAAVRAQLPSLAEDLSRRYLRRLNTGRDYKNSYWQTLSAVKVELQRQVRYLPADEVALGAALIDGLEGNHQDEIDAYRAVLLRAAGDPVGEKDILYKLYRRDSFPKNLMVADEVYARYFDLVSAGELRLMASGACPRPGMLATYLARRGQTELTATALTSHFSFKGPRWLLAKKARLYAADPRFKQQTRATYDELLGLPLQIDELLKRPDNAVTAPDRVWTHYAHQYGAWLAGQDDKRAAELLFAQVERQPINANAYVLIAQAWDHAREFDTAEAFLERAAMVGGEKDMLLIARARHEAAQGRRAKAIEALDGLLARPVTLYDLRENYIPLMREIGAGEEAVSRWRDVYRKQMDTLSRYSRREEFVELIVYAQTQIGTDDALDMARELLAAPVFRADDLQMLYNEDRLPARLQPWLWSLALSRATNDPRVTIYQKRSFGESALSVGLSHDDEALARRALTMLEQAAPREFADDSGMIAQRVRVALRWDDAERAEKIAIEYATTGYPNAREVENVYGVFERGKRLDCADRLWIAYYARRRGENLAGVEEREKALGAYLRLRQETPARRLLTELTELAGEDETRLSTLSAIAREGGWTDEALRLARQAVALFPHGAKARRSLTLALLAAERADEAGRELAQAYAENVHSLSSLRTVGEQAASIAERVGEKDWLRAAEALPQPLRALMSAYVFLQREKGGKALAALAELREPLRYPAEVYKLRARAARLDGDRAAEASALRAYLPYAPEDRHAALRLASVDEGMKPEALLLRLQAHGYPIAFWRLTEPLAGASGREGLDSWWNGLEPDYRADLAEAVCNAFVKLDRPQAALDGGEAALRVLGDKAPGRLRRLVAKLDKQVTRLRESQPVRFVPNENLVQ